MVILECPTKVSGRLQVVLDWLRTIWGPKTCKTWFFGWTYGKSLRRSGLDLRSLKNYENLEIFQKSYFFKLVWKSFLEISCTLWTLKARKHLKACFWACLRSLTPKKHPWMARRHSNSGIVFHSTSRMQTAGFSGYPTTVPGRPHVVFNRLTDSYQGYCS